MIHCGTLSITRDYVNAYVSPNFYVIDNVNNLKDLGIIMSSYCSFEHHIIELCKWCTGLLRLDSQNI